MKKHLIENLMFLALEAGVLFLLMLTAPSKAHGWTSAQIFNVDVTVDVSKEGLATVTTEPRFIVAGGHFHGFDLADLPGAELVEEACAAYRDDHQMLGVTVQVLRDGRKRVLLADEKSIRKGGITFKLIHRIDLVAIGALRPYEGRARLDWTPIIWDSGIDRMQVQVSLPGSSSDGPITVDQAVTRDYEVDIEREGITLTKYRPVRWYPMQTVVYFDAALIRDLDEGSHEKQVSTSIVGPTHRITQNKLPTALHWSLLPAVVALIGLLALVLKTRHVRRAFEQVGKEGQFVLLTRTSLKLRSVLALLVVILGIAVQYAGHLAAGIPAIVLAAAFFIIRRNVEEVMPRPGGTWRMMSAEDLKRYRRLLKLYRRSRRSLLDITTVRGFLSFGLYVTGLGCIAYITRQEAPWVAWSTVVDGFILGVPAWFSSIRAELPVDVTFEGFQILRKWRRSLSKLLGAKTPGATAEFWVREDEAGPIDVRLRVELAKEGLNNIEVAGEVFRAGTFYRTRTVFVLRLEPGSAVTRQLAKCPHAAEHHLTPDLQEEIIVLRNRRGRIVSGLSPIRGALAILCG